ncbi:MAG: tol-pal system protein YbgF [Nitrospinota bacterium]|jgi:tol-pal system protein YbgF|nr:tol-pal system protein YbgF [Nitrospinota bacterium]HJM42298.1 tol-pal system protein YbgF [Nitrospinota bacterium]
MARRVGGLLVGLLVLLAGCTTNEEVELLRSDIRRLKREVRQVRDEGNKKSQALQAAVSPVASRLEVLKKDIEKIRRTQADYETRLESTRRAATKATGSVEERRFRSRKRERELRDQQKSQESRLVILEKDLAFLRRTFGVSRPPPGAVAAARPPAPAGPPPSPSPSASPIPPVTAAVPTPPPVAPPPVIADDARAQTAALALLKGGKLKDARRKFQELLRRFPTSQLADDAQYWIGETYYLEKRYDKAILEYDKVVINYAKGDKVPGALLKQGFAFLALGDKASAKQLLNQLVGEHPDSDEAKTARSRLLNL